MRQVWTVGATNITVQYRYWVLLFQLPTLSPCFAVQTVIFSQNSGQRSGQQAVSEAALSTSLVHPNVVATYSFSMKPIQAALPGKEALQIEGGDQDWKLYLIQVCSMHLCICTRLQAKMRLRCEATCGCQDLFLDLSGAM